MRLLSAGVFPGKSLIVYNPVMRLPIDVFPCEDGHAQERSGLKQVPSTVKPSDVWIADCNFCTLDFTCGIAGQQAYFIIREHKKYTWQPVGKEKYIGKIATGKLYEQRISVKVVKTTTMFLLLRSLLKEKSRSTTLKVLDRMI